MTKTPIEWKSWSIRYPEKGNGMFLDFADPALHITNTWALTEKEVSDLKEMLVKRWK